MPLRAVPPRSSAESPLEPGVSCLRGRPGARAEPATPRFLIAAKRVRVAVEVPPARSGQYNEVEVEQSDPRIENIFLMKELWQLEQDAVQPVDEEQAIERLVNEGIKVDEEGFFLPLSVWRQLSNETSSCCGRCLLSERALSLVHPRASLRACLFVERDNPDVTRALVERFRI
ncbi:hypothetical protein NDU88_006842 [Pleurodeles waltl]|uniref:Uncharacterized protein n=1 Tax=Pleurodeles waltl TaxID=8319 RepID=A0AAV7VNS3_PLEWA|nr:hypothetical protein NDU88_006842 [Pleurodeles waltl]